MYIVLINSERSKIQSQAHKSKNPSVMAGVFQFQMVARVGIDRDVTVFNPY
jgi:hypothetical protein